MLATWGVGAFLQQLARSIVGALSVQVVAPSWQGGAVNICSDLVLPMMRIFILAPVTTSTGGLYRYMYRSTKGRRIRGVMQNREMVANLGVSARRVDRVTFALGCGLTLIRPIGPSRGTF